VLNLYLQDLAMLGVLINQGLRVYKDAKHG